MNRMVGLGWPFAASRPCRDLSNHLGAALESAGDKALVEAVEMPSRPISLSCGGPS